MNEEIKCIELSSDSISAELEATYRMEESIKGLRSLTKKSFYPVAVMFAAQNLIVLVVVCDAIVSVITRGGFSIGSLILYIIPLICASFVYDSFRDAYKGWSIARRLEKSYYQLISSLEELLELLNEFDEIYESSDVDEIDQLAKPISLKLMEVLLIKSKYTNLIEEGRIYSDSCS